MKEFQSKQIQRREFLKKSLFLIGGATLFQPGLLGCSPEEAKKPPDRRKPTNEIKWRMPDEGDPHAATWMAFCAREEIWGDNAPTVEKNLAAIANAIAAHEPVNMLVRQMDREFASSLVNSKVKLITAELDDLWVRDTGPVFVKNAKGELAGVDFNFNGWGGKQEHTRDKKVASFVLEKTGHKRITTKLVLEGGGIEVDGHGTAIITESCVLNSNRNSGVTKEQAETELKSLLGLEKIIWLPGVKGQDITDGHTDFYARFVKPGVVVAAIDYDVYSPEHKLTQRHAEILRAATDASGKKLEVHLLQAPRKVRVPAADRETFAAGYINFYLCNGGLILPEFGDASTDKEAKDLLQGLYPKRKITQLNIDGIAAGGGGIHCCTQQQPAL